MSASEQIITLKDGRRLGFAEYGDPKGKPLFFFHGWPNSRLHGEVLGKTAKKLGIRIISPDRPGYGISEFQKNRTLLDYASDIEQLADFLKLKKFSILGNSGGGPYAAVCAYVLPKRIAKVGIVVGLGPVSLDGMLEGLPLFNRLGWENYARVPFLTSIAALLLKLKANYLSSAVFFDYASDSDKAILKTVSMEALKKRRQEAFRQGIKGPAHDLLLYTREWGFSLKHITLPVHLWYGEKDKKVSVSQGRYYAREIPQNTFTLYPKEGHMIIYPHMEEIVQTVV